MDSILGKAGPISPEGYEEGRMQDRGGGVSRRRESRAITRAVGCGLWAVVGGRP